MKIGAFHCNCHISIIQSFIFHMSNTLRYNKHLYQLYRGAMAASLHGWQIERTVENDESINTKRRAISFTLKEGVHALFVVIPISSFTAHGSKYLYSILTSHLEHGLWVLTKAEHLAIPCITCSCNGGNNNQHNDHDASNRSSAQGVYLREIMINSSALILPSLAFITSHKMCGFEHYLISGKIMVTFINIYPTLS